MSETSVLTLCSCAINKSTRDTLVTLLDVSFADKEVSGARDML